MTRDAERERLISARVEEARANRADFLANASVMLLPAGNKETICGGEETGRTGAQALMTGLIRAGCVRLAIEDELRCAMQLIRIGWVAECRNGNKTKMDAEMSRAEMAERVCRKRVMRMVSVCTRALSQAAMREVVHGMHRLWSAALTLVVEPAHEDEQVVEGDRERRAKLQRAMGMLARERQVGMV